MALTRQSQVLDGLDRLAGKAMNAAMNTYKSDVLAPVERRVREAQNFTSLLRALSASALAEMDTSRVETHLADSMTQAAMIGYVASRPRKKE